MDDKPLAAALVWFRRDLRCDDHAALYHALRNARRVWCAFVFDRAILDRLGDPLVHLVRNAVDHGLELPEARTLYSELDAQTFA